jgi:protein-tyrosine phosphatase
VPDVEASSWPELADRLHALLDEGSKVFIHCRGGFGRSGMIAARLLVERGLDPAAALAHVRRARPGAVENAAQEAWVSRKIVASQKG